MQQKKASDFARDSLLSGYRHHSYALERELSRLMENGQWESIITTEELNLETYADILAPDRLRAMKNSLICFAALISRGAIDRGVPPEKSFSVSDYYINEIERQNSPRQLQKVLQQILMEYSQLERSAKSRAHSIPVSKAIHYIREHIYSRCPVAEVARAVGYNPQYLSVLFRQELGQSPSEYIREQKMKEAAALLRSGSCSAAEAAQSLGYCSASHFTGEFTRYYGMGPRQFLKNGGLVLQNQK